MGLPGISIDKYIESSLGLDEFGIGQLRSVEWSRKYLWSFGFIDVARDIAGTVGPNAPFDVKPDGSSFFPCVDVDETEAILNTFAGEAYGTSFQVPQRGDTGTLKITFLDDQDNTLYNFFRKWIKEDILNNGRYITPLEEAIKAVELRKVKLASVQDIAAEVGDLVGLSENKNNSIAASTKYWVFPTGSITYNGGSTSDTNIYTIDLVIAGIVDYDQADGGLGNTIQNIARSLGGTAVLGGIGRIFG